MNTFIKKIWLIALILPLTACFPPPFYPNAGYYQGGGYGYGGGHHNFHGGGHSRR